jgi:hypothetical protein
VAAVEEKTETVVEEAAVEVVAAIEETAAVENVTETEAAPTPIAKKAGVLSSMFKKMTLKRAPKAEAVEEPAAVEEAAKEAPEVEVTVSEEATKVFPLCF